MFAKRSHLKLAKYQQIPSTDARENAIRKITMHGQGFGFDPFESVQWAPREMKPAF